MSRLSGMSTPPPGLRMCVCERRRTGEPNVAHEHSLCVGGQMDNKEAVERKAAGWMREAMPNVAEQVDGLRAKYGSEHVVECIKRGMQGEPDQFYAFEAGQVIGTPFTADQVTMKYLMLAAAIGGQFACVMRPGIAAAAER